MPLSLRQEEFINAYLGEAKGNATQAARIAGYKGNDNALATSGDRLLRSAAIRTRIAQHREALGITRERILTGLLRVAEDDRPNNGIAAVKAYQLLGADMHGMFKPATQQTETEVRIHVIREQQQISRPDILTIASNTSASTDTDTTNNTETHDRMNKE